MHGLFAITEEVHRIFGDDVGLSFAYGRAESLEGDPHGNVTHGEEIGDDDVQREVERILGAPDASAQGGGRPGRGRLQISVGEDEMF